MQEEWDDEKEPDGFELTGSVPDAKADDPNVAGVYLLLRLERRGI